MRRVGWRALAFLLLTGCSTHPYLDYRDYFKAGKLYPNRVQPYGGTCVPQNPVLPPTPGPIGPPPMTGPPGLLPPQPGFLPPQPGVIPPPIAPPGSFPGGSAPILGPGVIPPPPTPGTPGPRPF